MIVLEMKAVIKSCQAKAIDDAIRTVQFIRNKALRLWLDASREDKIDKYALNKYCRLLNSPHNSPLWRRSLHDKIGCFDTNYKSAGDHEFWLRAAFSGAAFMKIPDPVVVYYQNPEGISTQKDSPGNIEGPETVKKYRSLLK